MEDVRQREVDTNITTRGSLESEVQPTLHRPQRTTRGKRQLFVFYKSLVRLLLEVCWAVQHQRGSISFYALSRKEKIQTKVNLKLFVAIRRLGVIKRQQSQTAVAIQFNVFILRLLGSRLSLCTLQSYYSASISQLCTMISAAFKNTTLKCASR